MKLLRTSTWWNAIVPQVLGWVYFSILTHVVYMPGGSISPLSFNFLEQAALFVLALMGIAAFGYLFNDFCDADADTRAGKKNSLASLIMPWRILLVLTPLLTGLAAWLELNKLGSTYTSNMALANALFGAQIIALIVYSAKPFRLKERAGWGIAFDAFYGHLNPALITIFVFGILPQQGRWYSAFLLLLILVCFIKGIRNILLHQIDDRKKDRRSALNTAVAKYGPWRIINFINDALFPAEIFLLVCFMLVIAYHIPPLIIPVLFFAVIAYLKFSGWKIGYADRRLLEFKFTYFMNDYYENWLPVFILIILSVYMHPFVFLLILHLVLFPQFIIKLVNDIKKINDNFKTEEDY